MEKSSLLLECFNCARPVSDLNKRRRRVDLRSTNSGVGITRRNGDALMEFILCRWVLNTRMVPPSISALVRRPNDCSGSKCRHVSTLTDLRTQGLQSPGKRLKNLLTPSVINPDHADS